MQHFAPENIRNVALVAAGGTGKSTLIQQLLVRSRTLDPTEEKAMLTEPEEQARQIAITPHIGHVEWNEHEIFLVDTPGYYNFLEQTNGVLPGVDGAVMLFSAIEGARPECKRLWRMLRSEQVPTIGFLNAIDHKQSTFVASLKQIQEALRVKVIPLAIPLHDDAGHRGVVDLLAKQAWHIQDGTMLPMPLPAEMQEEVDAFRTRLVEMIIENDLQLTEQYLNGEEISAERLSTLLRALLTQGELLPMYCGSAIEGIGIEALLNTIVALLPNPLERDDARPFGNGRGEYRHCNPAEPTSAIVLKTIIDPYSGKLSVVRVISGTLHSNQVLRTGAEEERSGAVYLLQGSQMKKVDKLVAGEIGAIARLDSCLTGDTLSDPREPIEFPRPQFAEPSVSFAIGGEAKAIEGLRKLTEEDPTLHIERDPSTNETILSGMGQAHIEIALERLARKFGAKATLRQRRVPYQETIQRSVRVQGKLKKQTGGHGQFANCFLEVAPNERGKGLQFEDHVKGGVIPKQYIPAIEKGAREALQQGPLGGYPVVDLIVRIVDGSFHTVDSSDLAFSTAGSFAIKDALTKGGTSLLEPIMEVTVQIPDSQTGEIVNDLATRRGRISKLESLDGVQEVTALVPLAEMLDYGNSLTATTSGRGTYRMERSHYETVPPHLTDEALAH